MFLFVESGKFEIFRIAWSGRSVVTIHPIVLLVLTMWMACFWHWVWMDYRWRRKETAGHGGGGKRMTWGFGLGEIGFEFDCRVDFVGSVQRLEGAVMGHVEH